MTNTLSLEIKYENIMSRISSIKLVIEKMSFEKIKYPLKMCLNKRNWFY